MTLTVDYSSVNINTPTSLNATVTYWNGTPVPGATITLSALPSGLYFEKTTYTTVALFYSTSWNSLITKFQSSTPNTYTITATATKAGYNTGNATKTVTIMAPVTTPTAQAPTPTAGTTATTQAITPIPPTGTPGAESVTPAGPTAQVASPTANANTTTAGGMDLGGLGGILPYIAIAVLVILIILAIVLYLWFKKNLRVIPKAASAACDGKSTIPVRVMFVNGFGKPRRNGSDVEVEMKSTAGTIHNVVLSGSRDFAETSLTAPAEFGTATITAMAGNKTANAQVNFTYKHATFEVTVDPGSIPADGKSSANVTLRIKDDGGNYIAPILERDVELKSSLGTVTGMVKMPSKALSVNATITSGDVSGTAVIYATSGDLRGEGSIVLEGMPKRFCMHCGSPMTMEASQCPKCKLTPPSGVDTKQCSTCGTVIPESAMFCYQCGARQPEMVKPQQPQDSGANRN